MSCGSSKHKEYTVWEIWRQNLFSFRDCVKLTSRPLLVMTLWLYYSNNSNKHRRHLLSNFRCGAITWGRSTQINSIKIYIWYFFYTIFRNICVSCHILLFCCHALGFQLTAKYEAMGLFNNVKKCPDWFNVFFLDKNNTEDLLQGNERELVCLCWNVLLVENELHFCV